MYIELHARSAFSFLEGASLPETLAGRAAEMEFPAMALLDRDGLYGAPRFHHAALKIKFARISARNLRPPMDFAIRFSSKRARDIRTSAG